MIILRNRNFSFMEKMKGNPKLRKSIQEYQSIKPDNDILDEFPSLKGHDDFLRYLTWLSKNVPSSSTTMWTQKGTGLIIYSYSGMMNQANGKYPIAVQRTGEERFVLLQTNCGDNDFIISYHPKTKEYIITRESARYMILNRAINNIFGQKGPQLVGKFKSFGQAFNYINKNIYTTTVYYSEKDFAKHDENWYKGEETDFQKRNRKNIVKTLAGFGATTGAYTKGFKTWEDQSSKRYAKKLEAENADFIKKIKLEELKGLRGVVNPADRAAYNKYVENATKIVKNSEEATKRFMKRADKVVTKNTLKGGVKGAAKGLAIGGGLAIVANHALKKSHERGNAIRRNKTKKKNS